MRVLLYRQHVCQDGVASWTMTLAAQLRRLGVECAFWFPKVFYKPVADFERLGPVYTAPPHQADAVLRTGPYDVVQVVNSDPTAALLGLLRPLPRMVVTSHGDLADGWHGGNCFAYTAVSEDMAALNQPLTDLEVEVVPNGVDCERFTPPDGVEAGAPVVAWVGRSTDARKDFPRFTRVAARLAQKGVRLWVADAHGASWQDLAGQDCCRVAFERWRRVPAADMPQFYRELAANRGALLMTSRHEGWGLAATEAAACGVPTLGPDVVGLRRAILPGVTGAFYPVAASDDEVADRVWDLLQAGGRESGTAAACAAAARRAFSAEAMARRYLEIYARPRQRRCERPAGAAAGPVPAGLLARLRTHRWHRAAFLSEAAGALARAGQGGLAWRAVRRSVATAPRSAAHPARTLQLLTTTAVLLGRLVRPGLHPGFEGERAEQGPVGENAEVARPRAGGLVP
jgi:glycosyltransferase involved in cell wall biosynthesis